ncbi:hypothetical protein GCM10022402_43510 [Salinactinospora qingdaonensis]|uniref:Uncharacterized protein n=1 Tax=Salinactinospora qingdaonensis TaxID=702744 RepID=A0ABP7GB19_9ACTN
MLVCCGVLAELGGVGLAEAHGVQFGEAASKPVPNVGGVVAAAGTL